MTWTYSGNPASSFRDEVRFLVGDTDEALPLLQDEEIDYLIAFWRPRYDSSLYVGAMAAEQISQKFAGVVSISADGVSVSVGDISGKYDARATKLRAAHVDAQSVGAEIDISNLFDDAELDPSIAPLNFAVGGMDNPAAGHQAVGGHQGPRWSYDERGWVQ